VPAMCGALRPWWAAGFTDVEFVVAVMPIPTTGVLSKADRGQGELEHNPPPTETRHHDDGTAAKDICCGLGHLGVQFGVKMGFRTVAIARGPEKGELARQLGAHHYIDSVASDVAAELQKLGGARVIAATATDADAMTAAVGGLGLHGELLTLAVVDDPVQVSPTQLISISGTVHGHTSGASCDLEDTLNFAALQGIKPMVEVLPLEKVADGYQRMVTNQARFRVVLTTAH
jgi:alcohol dehydrogenase